MTSCVSVKLSNLFIGAQLHLFDECCKVVRSLQHPQHPQSSLPLSSPSQPCKHFKDMHFGDSNHIKHVAQSNDQLPLSLSLRLILFSLQSPPPPPFSAPFLLPFCVPFFSCFDNLFQLQLATCNLPQLTIFGALFIWAHAAAASTLPLSPPSPKLTLPQRPLIKYSISATTQCRRCRCRCLLSTEAAQGSRSNNNNNNKK